MSNKTLRYITLTALSLLLASPCAVAYINHTVKRGETTWGVASKYGISADDLLRANPHAERGLKKGMQLRIPEKSDLGIAVDQPATPAAKQPEAPQPVKQQEAPQPVQQPEVPQPVQQPEAPQPVQQPEAPLPITDQDTPATADAESPKVYIAKFGDTLHSVSMKTGVSETKLLAYNPLIDTKRIPEGYPIRLSEDAPYISPSGDMTLIDSIAFRVIPVPSGADSPDGTPVANTAANELTVAVMLPFDTSSETISRQSLLATDFYKGFLLATKDALDQSRFPLKIIAVDTQCDDDKFDSKLNELMLSDVSVIIPPEDESQLEKIQTAALEHGIIVLNALSVRDEGYLKYPNVVQCNINQKMMYDKAISALMTDFADYTPVILDLSGGKDEKLSFIEELRRQYAADSRKVIDLSFKNMLTADDLATLPASGKYVFIPKSGSAEVFNKLSEALTTLINENFTEDKYKVFGYPDWITFKGEQEEALHNMGATIYSRFYMDPTDPRTDDVNKDFVKWYGYQMEEVYPCQGMLGYDIGRMVMSKLKDVDRADTGRAIERGRYSGRQSSFKFVKPSDAPTATPGMINDVLYLIEYLPGTLTNYRTL